MNKIIMTLGIASSLLTSTVKKDGTIINSVERDKYLISEALNNIQDMKEWMQSDIDKDNVITDLGEYYLEYLNETEDLLINEINK